MSQAMQTVFDHGFKPHNKWLQKIILTLYTIYFFTVEMDSNQTVWLEHNLTSHAALAVVLGMLCAACDGCKNDTCMPTVFKGHL